LILVVTAVVLSTGCGIFCDRRLDAARAVAQRMLRLMLYVLVPFVSFVNIAHLHITVGAGVGLGFAYLVIGGAGLAAWAGGRFWLRLADPEIGALICSVVIVNTGYLGLPTTVALLGPKALSSAVAYDQLVSGPMLFLVGFGVGAAFGTRAGAGGRARLKAFLTRNPPLLAVIAGLLAPASLAPEALVRASHVVVAGLLVLGFFAVGVNLSAERREDAAPLLELPDRRVGVAVGLRVLLPPLLLAGFSAVLVRLPTAYLLEAAMPTGITTLVIGHAYGLDQRLIATIIVWSTALAVAAFLVISTL
jgi:malate permease and related proteins